jgi:hypothetical protein
MKLRAGQHLAYSTNVHPGESWMETLRALERHTLAVRAAVAPDQPFGIGLRLSDRASRELIEPSALSAFRKWLAAHDCYVFTINGFPFGTFHDARVKEQVYLPDWTTRDRLEYTNRLFDILSALLPDGVEGSVSTVPGSFKEFIRSDDQIDAMRGNLRRCDEHIASVTEKVGCKLHLGLEPEPLGFLENTDETLRFFERLPNEHLGVNYDACHFAVEYEDPHQSLQALHDAGIRISKLHLSSALRCESSAEAKARLGAFADDVYLHQVIGRQADGQLYFHKDLSDLIGGGAPFRRPGRLAAAAPSPPEWRIHFHVPLYAELDPPLATTIGHVTDALDWLAAHPNACSHLEMETYTWQVLPEPLRSASLTDQLVREYEWTLARLRERNLA